MAFKIAGSMAFQKGVMDCQPILLEPIVNIDIEVPDEYMGDVIGDLKQPPRPRSGHGYQWNQSDY
ncbi:MAG: hypothetical protein MZV70_28000 [Desulfobacterales bacterium]|nr:hypothetical protein [Desulfobacterales bacterium]